jgi:indole-3-glycerol phosphate synthase
MTILDEIFAAKREEVSKKKKHISISDLQSLATDAAAAIDFLAAIRTSSSKPALIAEVKRASPSRGLIANDFDPIRLARIYQQNGATAISVLTDQHYFKGDLEYLQAIAMRTPRIPLLRKDFLYDPYQVYESRAAGADAVLLIVASLSIAQLHELHDLSQQLGMSALVEVHTIDELEVALHLEPNLIGINNRNLHDFSVDLGNTQRLRAQIPTEICVVAESGVHTPEDVEKMAVAGADAILVGEALVAAPDVSAQVRALVGAGSDESKNLWVDNSG